MLEDLTSLIPLSKILFYAVPNNTNATCSFILQKQFH